MRKDIQVMAQAREALELAHENWYELAHDSTSSCKVCRAIKAIDDYTKENQDENSKPETP